MFRDDHPTASEYISRRGVSHQEPNSDWVEINTWVYSRMGLGGAMLLQYRYLELFIWLAKAII